MNEITFEQIDREIRALDLSTLEGNTLVADTPATRLQRVVRIYKALRPFFAALATLPILPDPWRAALAVFIKTLDAVGGAPADTRDFKAGKDL